MLAGGMLAAFSIAARFLGHGADPYRIAAYGAVIGLFAFAAVIFAAPLDAPLLFRIGVLLIGFGGGFFSVGTLAGAMARERNGESGLALGAWGAVQATSAGLAIALGGAVRDGVTSLAVHGSLGPALTGASTGYSVGVPDRDRPAVRDPGGHRAAGARRHAGQRKGAARSMSWLSFPIESFS